MRLIILFLVKHFKHIKFLLPSYKTIKTTVPTRETKRVSKWDCCPGWKHYHSWRGCLTRKENILNTTTEIGCDNPTFCLNIYKIILDTHVREAYNLIVHLIVIGFAVGFLQ